MRKSTLTALSLLPVCLLALVGCKPSSNQASVSASQPAAARSATPSAPPAQASTPPQAANVSQSVSSPMTPGLWEITVQSDQMKLPPQIPPQQAEQMRKMGVNVPEIRNGNMVMKVCYTKEMLAKSGVPSAQSDQECRPKSTHSSGSSFSGEVVCDGPNMKGTGIVQGTMTATSFQSTNRFTGTMGGQPANHQTQTNGTFISADCGSVMPIRQP